MAKQTLKKKGKKEWYKVIAPDVFKNQELGEIQAYEPKDLVGRHIQLSYSVLTNSPRDKSKNFTVFVKDVVEKNARTEPIKIIYSTGYIQRFNRRCKTKSLHVGKYTSADDKKVTIKSYMLATNKITRSVNTNLIKKIDSLLKSKISKTESANLFGLNYMESLSKELKTKLKTIYPLSGIVFWKIEVA